KLQLTFEKNRQLEKHVCGSVLARGVEAIKHAEEAVGDVQHRLVFLLDRVLDVCGYVELQGSVVIVTTGADYLSRMSNNLLMACRSGLWSILVCLAVSGPWPVLKFFIAVFLPSSVNVVSSRPFLIQLDGVMDLFAFIHHADPTKNDNIESVSHNDPYEESSDADPEDQFEGKDHFGQDELATILVDEEVQVVAADKPKRIKKKRRATGGASGSNHPPKKLRKDHGTSSNVSASTSRKSLAAIQGLLERSTLNVEAGLRQWQVCHLLPPSSSVMPPLVMTMAVTTTIIVSTSSALVLRADAELVTQVYQSPFANSTFIEMNSKTLCQIYVPKCNVVNESVLDDPDLFSEFNVGVSRQTCVFAKVRMWSEHNLRERKRFKRRCVRELNSLKERNIALEKEKTTLEGQIIGHGLRLDIIRCQQSPEYAAAFVAVVGLTIDKGIQAGLVAGIDHRKSRRGLAVIASYDPSVEAITSGVPAIAAATTALSISVTDVNVSSIPPILVGNYDVLDAGIHDEVPHSSKIVFEKENLETISEHPSVS
nr:hypothetical protein [Tanacetum cinerariifolium]